MPRSPNPSTGVDRSGERVYYEPMSTSVYSDPKLASQAHANLRAEMRATEDGRHARLDPSGRSFLVKSSDGSRDYRLTAEGRDGLLTVTCDCAWGSCNPPVPGQTGCRHAARVARRFEREHLVRFDGIRWVLTPKAGRLAS